MTTPQGIPIVRSRVFNGTDASGGHYSTHYALLTLPNGEPVDAPVEHLLDAPTDYPVDPELRGMTGDYHAMVMAQQSGRHAAHTWLSSHSETAPDRQDTERRRQIVLARIAAVARELQRTA